MNFCQKSLILFLRFKLDFAKITRLARKRYRQTIGGSELLPDLVPIACYICEGDYNKICEDELTFYEHWALLALFGEMCGKGGVNIIFCPIIPEDYFLWLEQNGLKNNYGSRARYANFMVTGTANGYGVQEDD
jgi:hypothetical protein